MPAKQKAIPVNTLSQQYGKGIFIAKASTKDFRPDDFDEVRQAHRDDYHLFFLQEKGTTSMAVDFQKYRLKPQSAMYIQPNQVHHVLAVENATLSIWAVSNEAMNPEYLKLLEDIAPAKPLPLKTETFAVISEAAALCIRLFGRDQERLYDSLLKDSCNALVGLVASQYLVQSKPSGRLSRFEAVSKAFRSALERDFATVKSPTAYAKMLNISASYLNECVRHTTGHTISYHIQQRIVLEAKRLLYHSDQSVKEIADELGYEDYAYFSRLFTKVAGMTALTFRNKNRD